MVQDAVFSPKVVIWLITVGLLSFAGAIYFVIYGDEGIARTSGANSFSYSAIGHRAFVETLRRMDVPVLVSRDDSAAKAGRSALLVVAEPRWRAPTDDTVDDLLSADTLLIVLARLNSEVCVGKETNFDKMYSSERRMKSSKLSEERPNSSYANLIDSKSITSADLTVL